MIVTIDCTSARNRMLLRARRMRDVAHRPLEQAAADGARTAAATTAWKDKSGGTRASIQPFLGPGLSKAGFRARRAAVFLEAGTGRYGLRGRDYVIAAKNSKYLHFRGAGGNWVFASHVIHPGIKPTHFMRDAGEQARPRFVASCVRAVQQLVAHP
jgi:hypothetical protein